MIRVSVVTCLLLALGVLMSGCVGTQIDVAPPCASVRGLSQDPDRTFRGQAVMVGNRLLTAGHTFAQEGNDFPPNRIQLNNTVTEVRSPRHGDPETIRRLYHPDHAPTPAELAQDWVAFEVEPRAALSVTPWLQGDGKTSPGEILYGVRMDTETGDPTYTVVPLKVVRPDSEELLSQGLIPVTSARGRNLKGWSGCFVGRFHQETQQWELTGILICSRQEEKGGSKSLHIVLRPPAEALEWLQGR